ncbi:hypothetical protein LSM04_009601 [Trypanosoma melophagium]|uniref:uncharacterized protein n=1 Tax=Trypanosoma melophagium TaxID=715481 RepID=UPI00351A1803|nr:hypothetical protein LSM04_009601 [Trypanosoma melophagium]
MDVQILHKANPPRDLRLSAEERQNAIAITIPLRNKSDGHHTATVSTAEDIVDLIADLPPGTRSRIVFLLSPHPQETFESIEKPQEKEEELKEKKKRELPMKRGVMRFTETPTLSIARSDVSVNHPHKLYNSPQRDASSLPLLRRELL